MFIYIISDQPSMLLLLYLYSTCIFYWRILSHNSSCCSRGLVQFCLYISYINIQATMPNILMCRLPSKLSILKEAFPCPLSRPQGRPTIPIERESLAFLACRYMHTVKLNFLQHIFLSRGHTAQLHIYVPSKTQEGGWVHPSQLCPCLATNLLWSSSSFGISLTS